MPNPHALTPKRPPRNHREGERRARAFWRFSLAFYRQNGVADTCLALQDRGGFDVNLLLYCLFVAKRERCRLAGADLRAAQALLRPVNRQAILPLRRLRLALEQRLAALPADGVGVLRRQILQAELAAEHLAQRCLGRAGPRGAPDQRVPAAAARQSLANYARLQGRNDRATRTRLEVLASRLTVQVAARKGLAAGAASPQRRTRPASMPKRSSTRPTE